VWWMTIDCDDYNDRISCTDPRWVHAKYSMDLHSDLDPRFFGCSKWRHGIAIRLAKSS
jgi:hypothetical protein